MRAAVACLALAALLLGACGGDTTAPTTIETSPISSAAATASPTPEPLPPVIGTTDPEGDFPIPEADVVAAEGYFDGDVLLVVFHLAQASKDLSPALVRWTLNVWPDGIGPGGPPPFYAGTTPLGASDTASAGAVETATLGGASWTAGAVYNQAEHTIRLAARFPGLSERTVVGPLTQIRTATAGSLAPGDQVRSFALTRRPLAALELPGPIALASTADGLREATAPGFPAIVAPTAWRWYLQSSNSNLQATPRGPPSGPPALGAFVRRPRAGEGPAALLDGLIAETGGKYVRLPDDGYGLLPGFEAGVLLLTTESFQMPYDPSKILQEWSSNAGIVTRLIAGRTGDSIVVAGYESDGSPLAAQNVDLLKRVRLTPP